MKRQIPAFLLTITLLGSIAYADDIDVTGSITSDETWTAGNDYYLDGFVFIEDGATVTIEPGVVVRGYLGTGASASALIVKRGGKIMAQGTPENPIIFTAEDDADLDQPSTVRGSWGGLIFLGKGTHNNLDDNNGIEGVPSEANAFYGGSIEDDNSGILEYVSIRHGGSELAPDEEINGLTLGAVGSGTTINFVEVMGNSDDGIEWFGGSVNATHLVVSDCGDDSYDIDEGYNGKLQFIYTQQLGDGTGDNFGEHDGGPSSNRWGTPYTTPIISNATFIGGSTTANDRCLTLREFFGGSYFNSIFAEQGRGIRVEYVPEFDAGENGGSFTMWKRGILKIENNIFQNVSDGTAEGIFTVNSPVDDNEDPVYVIPEDSAEAFAAYFATAGNTVNNSLGISKTAPIPDDSLSVKGAVFEGLDTRFNEVIYKGAFSPCVSDAHWAGGWTWTFRDVAFNASDDNSCYDAGTGTALMQYKDETVSAYPNPATDLLTISFANTNGTAVSVKIYNMNGQAILTAATTGSSIDLDVSGITPGIYTYRVAKNETLVHKGQIVIE